MSSGTIARESRFEQIVPLADAPDRPIPAAIAPTTSLATTDVARITPPVLRSPPSLDSLDLSPELSGTYTDSIAAPPSASRWSANRPLVDEHDSPETSRFSGLEDSKSIHQSRPSLAPSDRSFTPSYFEHVIVDGDTLADLAKRYLGGAERWPEIYEGNREVLTDPDLLPIGATIQIPQP